MSQEERLIIQVPASTANVGPGFDSVGLALNLYLTIEVNRSTNWEVIPMCEELKVFPQDESNFIVQTALKVAKKYNKDLPKCSLKVKSDIPLARGLGSSASAIVAGIELADALCDLQLSKKDKFTIASEIEGHPDNVGASVFGGLVVGCQTEEEVNAEIFYNLSFEMVAVVPNEELLTKKSRSVLPTEVSFKEAVAAGAVANVLIASLLNGNFELAGKMMKKDRYHQPFRKKLVPHLPIIEEIAPQHGAFGVALSGAGPTVLCFTQEGLSQSLISEIEKKLPNMSFISLQIDNKGSQLYHADEINKNESLKGILS
ncbi:homoserine kinase [Bacillus sp. 03113]|uniref:homoserine kinase n=1 Tax=Bacillus sp. 03113 TaxID=2578211 RepID=UPI001142572F|nr:homoserine kinase [Bacillus sp. 03113]